MKDISENDILEEIEHCEGRREDLTNELNRLQGELEDYDNRIDRLYEQIELLRQHEDDVVLDDVMAREK